MKTRVKIHRNAAIAEYPIRVKNPRELFSIYFIDLF